MAGEGNGDGQGNTGAGNGDEQGNETPSFIETLGDDFKGNAAFEGVEDAGGLAAKYVDTLGQVGELTEQNAALQRETPDDVSGYDLQLPEGLAEADAAAFDSFKELAHELKLTPVEAQKLAAFDLKLREDAMTAFDTARDAAKDELVKEFGDKYDAKLDEVQAVLKKFGGESMLADIDISDPKAGLMNHPDFFRFVSKVADVLSPDSLEGGDGNGSGGGGEKQLHEILYPNS